MFKSDPSDPLDYFRDISSFGGCTAGPTAAIESFAIIEQERLLANARSMGARLLTNLRRIQEKRRVIGDVRGEGLFAGAELVMDRTTKQPAPEAMVRAVVEDCLAQGVIIGATNRSFAGFNNCLCIAPSLNVAPDEIDAMTDAVDAALARTFP
jgi:taurine-pyruvate aminotransferase